MKAAPPRWTLNLLEQACRKALKERARIKLASLPVGYDADMWGAGGGGALRVRHDYHKAGLIDTAIHEMLHDVLDQEVGERFDEDTEEIIVAALETALCLRIKSSRRRLAWWREATSGKTTPTPKP